MPPGLKVLGVRGPERSQGTNGVVVDVQPRAGAGIPVGSHVTTFVGGFSGG